MSSPRRKKLVIKDVDQQFHNVSNANNAFRGYNSGSVGFAIDNTKEDITQSSSKKEVGKVRGENYTLTTTAGAGHKKLSKNDIDVAFYDDILNKINDNNINEPMSPMVNSNRMKKSNSRKGSKSKAKSKKEKSAKSIQHILVPEIKGKEFKGKNYKGGHDLLEIDIDGIEMGDSSEVPITALKSPMRTPHPPSLKKRSSPKLFTLKLEDDTTTTNNKGNLSICKDKSKVEEYNTITIMKKQRETITPQQKKRNSFFFQASNKLADDIIVKVAEVQYNSIRELKEVNSMVPSRDDDKEDEESVVKDIGKKNSKVKSNSYKKHDDVLVMKKITNENPFVLEDNKRKENSSEVGNVIKNDLKLNGCNDEDDKEKDSSQCKLGLKEVERKKKRKMWFCCIPVS